MRSLTCLFFACALLVSSAVAQTDQTLAAGLQAFEANGIPAGIRTWYGDNPRRAAEMQAKLLNTAKDLGDIVGTEVLQVRSLSNRVQRYYVAIYFTERPLWVRLDRYSVGLKTFFLPLECSIAAEQILPEAITGH